MGSLISKMMASEDVVKAHAVGTELEDVKVTFLHDVKIKVGDIDIQGKQGEILNLPRWVADVLESENHIQIQETDMVVELKQAIVKENVQGEFELSTLYSNFYIKLNSYLKKLPQQDFDKVESMLNSLVRKREGKIIQLAGSSKLTGDLSKKLTIEEHQFYENIYKSATDFKKQVIGDKK